MRSTARKNLENINISEEDRNHVNRFIKYLSSKEYNERQKFVTISGIKEEKKRAAAVPLKQRIKGLVLAVVEPIQYFISHWFNLHYYKLVIRFLFS